MRISLSLPELEAGKTIQTGSTERVLELCLMADKREPLAVSPVTDHDRRVISVVLLTEGIRKGKSSCELHFRPAWNKTFTLYSSRDKLLALIVELANGKFWVNEAGYKPCTLTTNGNGTDPRDVHNSQFTLADMMNEPRRSYVLLQALELLKKCA
jgi:hypothetical protein